MKTRSCLSFTPLGAVLALACMILAGGAAAKASPYNFRTDPGLVGAVHWAWPLQGAHVIQAGA